MLVVFLCCNLKASFMRAKAFKLQQGHEGTINVSSKIHMICALYFKTSEVTFLHGD